MRKYGALAGACVWLGTLAGCQMVSGPPLETVDDVDLTRYTGKWYEVARYPNWFQGEDCVGATAEYTLRDDGRIRVENRCTDPDTGEVDSIVGTARVPDPTEPAKLKVSFFSPFEGDYWIIDLDQDDYQWAVVGEPSRSFLWILSRDPELDPEVYAAILERLPEKGYDPDRLIVSRLPAGA